MEKKSLQGSMKFVAVLFIYFAVTSASKRHLEGNDGRDDGKKKSLSTTENNQSKSDNNIPPLLNSTPSSTEYVFVHYSPPQAAPTAPNNANNQPYSIRKYHDFATSGKKNKLRNTFSCNNNEVYDFFVGADKSLSVSKTLEKMQKTSPLYIKLVSARTKLKNCHVICNPLGLKNCFLITASNPYDKKYKYDDGVTDTRELKLLYIEFLKIMSGINPFLEEKALENVVNGKQLDDLYSVLRRLEEHSINIFRQSKILAGAIRQSITSAKIGKVNIMLDDLQGFEEVIYFSPMRLFKKIKSIADSASKDTCCADKKLDSTGKELKITFGKIWVNSDALGHILIHIFAYDPIAFFDMKQLNHAWYRCPKFMLVSRLLNAPLLHRYITIVHNSHDERIVRMAVNKKRLFRFIPNNVLIDYVANYLSFPLANHTRSNMKKLALSVLFDNGSDISLEYVKGMSTANFEYFLNDMSADPSIYKQRSLLQELYSDAEIMEMHEKSLLELLKVLYSDEKLSLVNPQLTAEIMNAADALPDSVLELIKEKELPGIFGDTDYFSRE